MPRFIVPHYPLWCSLQRAHYCRYARPLPIPQTPPLCERRHRPRGQYRLALKLAPLGVNIVRQGACSSGGKAIVLLGLTPMTMSDSWCWRNDITSTMLGVTPAVPMLIPSKLTKATTPCGPNFSRTCFSTGRSGTSGMPNSASLLAFSLYCTPQEEQFRYFYLSSVFTWKDTSARLSPYHVATNGISTGTHMASSVSTTGARLAAVLIGAGPVG